MMDSMEYESGDESGVEEDLSMLSPVQRQLMAAALGADPENMRRILRDAAAGNTSEGKGYEGEGRKQGETLATILNTCRDADGYTPLHRACYSGHLEVTQILLESGSTIEAVTVDGWTPLHSAASWGHAHIVSLLIRVGADVNALTHGGLTPLHVAAAKRTNRDALIALLTAPLVDTTLKNKAGDTAHDIARRSGPWSSLFELAHPRLGIVVPAAAQKRMEQEELELAAQKVE